MGSFEIAINAPAIIATLMWMIVGGILTESNDIGDLVVAAPFALIGIGCLFLN